MLVTTNRAGAGLGARSRWLAVLALLPLLTGCTFFGGDEENPLSGILLGADDLSPRSVDADAIPELPDTAPAYTVSLPTEDDLEQLSEAYAGGPVVPGVETA